MRYNQERARGMDLRVHDQPRQLHSGGSRIVGLIAWTEVDGELGARRIIRN